jgi:predicted CoA-binding protein
MATLADIQDFLAQKRLAIVGVSRQPQDFSRMLFREFLKHGYDAVPVNPQAPAIEDRRCYPDLESVAPPVDTVLLMTPPSVTDQAVHECARAGVRRVWMYRASGTGAVSPDAVEFCRSQQIAVVDGECPMMFLDGAPWFHRLHGLVKKIFGAYPK